MEPLKEMFNRAYFRRFAEVFAQIYPPFEKEKFLKEVTAGLNSLELNQRLRHTSLCLHRYLPADFRKAVAIIRDAAPALPRGYTALVMPDYVGLYGREHFRQSMEALKYFTVFGSSEFAVREFFRIDPKRTLQVMNKWAADQNCHVRRLASEGSRPRLPWSFRLDAVIREPDLTKTILEQLKGDEELYVKKSVANHLNDISKDNAAYMINLVSKWDQSNSHTRWIIKHASRTLIKKGHPDSLALFAFEKNLRVSLENISIAKERILLGEELSFQFDLVSRKKSAQKLVIDYAIHYPKANGGFSRKVFKLKEVELSPASIVTLKKKQRFQDFSTRKHYPGKYKLEIMVNGKQMSEKMFTLEVLRHT